MTAVASPKTYREFFQNPNLDPIGSGDEGRPILQSVYHQWRSKDTAPDAVAVLQATLNHFEEAAVGGIGMFVRAPSGEAQLRIAHGIRKYPGSLGVESILRDQVFGYLDDVDEGSAEIVQLNDALFGLTGAVNVASNEHHKLALEADPTLRVLPARADGADHTEAVQARMTAFIPFSLMPLLIEKRLPAREAYLIAEAHLTSEGVVGACGPLLDFLRVAGTRTANGVLLNSLLEPGPPFRAEKGLTKYMRKKVLLRDLKAYAGPTNRPDAATAALTSAVATLTDHQVKADAANQRKRDEDDRDKTIPEAFGALSTRKLLVMCRKTVDAELPLLYLRLANKKKREDLLTIMQQTIEEIAEPLGAPVVTITPATMAFIKVFRFHGNDDTDIGSGVLPMSFVPPGGVSGKARARRIEDATSSFAYMNMMGTDGQHITSADAQSLSRAKGYVPCKWTEAMVQLRAYAPVLAAIVGTAHPLFAAYEKGFNLYMSRSIMLNDALEGKVGERLAPGLLVYIFQIRLKGWFENQWTMQDELAVPDFAQGFWRYLLDRNLEWLPDVLSIPELRQLALPPDAPPRGTHTRGAPSNSGSSGGDAVPRPDTRRNAGNLSPPAQTRVPNETMDPRFQESNELCQNIKNWKVMKAIEAMKALGKAVPKDSSGRDRCISFHVKGVCFSNCRNKHDHQPIPSGIEANQFYDWCREAYT